MGYASGLCYFHRSNPLRFSTEIVRFRERLGFSNIFTIPILPIGYTEPGSPLRWPTSNFDCSSSRINATCGGWLFRKL